jgi:DNA-binding protein H-NS
MATHIDLSTLSFAELQRIANESNAAVQARREETLKELVNAFKSHLAQNQFTVAEALELLRSPQKDATRKQVGRKRAPAAKSASQPKYRDPKSGKTWTGHGRAPDWIKGKNREKFAI